MRTTGTMRMAAALVGGVVIILIVIGGIALANNDSTATCPDGQSLAVSRVNGDKFTQQGDLPAGATIQDSVSGSGLDYTLNSTNDSATLKVHGKGTATLQIACR